MTRQTGIRLGFCAALAFGEGLAAVCSTGAEAWPVVVFLAALVALIGYGAHCRAWPFVALALVGAALFWSAAVERERGFRRTPWLRDARRQKIERREPSPLRADLSRRLGLGLSHCPATVALNRAILLGERARLPAATKRVFVESGTIHVFAISGLHVLVVARVFAFLLALAFVPIRWQGALAVPLVWGYVLLVGAPPSAVRAALMASLCGLAPLFGRRADSLDAWATAFLAVHLLAPLQIADVGSQLSFAVMLALVVAGRVTHGLSSPRVQALCIAFAAWAAGVPIAAAVFGRVTPGGLLANLVLITAASYSVSAGAVGAVASLVSERFAAHFNNLSALMTEAMVRISEIVARLPGANFEVARWDLSVCIGWYAALALVFWALGVCQRRRDLV